MTRKLYEFLITKQDHIIDEWVNNPIILEEFSTAKIPPHFFQHFFAPRIFEHLMKILDKESPMGDCPAMGAMLRFFKNHHITPKALYRICSTFRNKVVKYLIESGFFSSQNYKVILDILDRNFERILIEYIELNFVEFNGVSGSSIIQENDSIFDLPQCPVVTQHEILTEQNMMSATVFHQKNIIEHDDTNDLVSLDEAIHDAIYSAESSGGEISHIHHIMHLFSKFGTALSLINEFQKLSESFTGMARVLDNCVDELSEEIITNLLVMLEALANDINKWLDTIFIIKNAKDIHYLDASMIASSEQCIAMLQSSESENCDEGFDDIFF